MAKQKCGMLFRLTEEDILKYEGFFSMEMCNYSSYLIGRLEYNGALYDKLLCSGKRMFCHSYLEKFAKK